MPTRAEAGLLSSFMGTQVSAQAPAFNLPENRLNSQTLGLPQAKISPASIIQEKAEKAAIAKTKTTTTKDEVTVGKVKEDESVSILSENALMPVATPTDLDLSPDSGDFVGDSISVYVVRKGDSLSQIADMFGVSSNTILWANDMKKGEALKEGDVLFILPISGLEHTVTKGQTLAGIAKLYKADAGDIASYNNIPTDAELAVGDQLIIPNAEKAEENDKPVKNLPASVAKDQKYYAAHPTQNLAGYYINPVPGARKSQGIHDKNAVDLATPTGTPIHAAASGRVTLARMGYNGGFGNLVIIKHANGTETLYAHQSSIATTTGANVTQGQVIGYVGSTGRSTGPHLHFEVHGARNPGSDNSWKK